MKHVSSRLRQKQEVRSSYGVMHSPISWPLGSARSINVKTSSFERIVTFVIVGELIADRTMVYGIFPPLMVRPHGSHVFKVSVTFGCIDAILCGVVGIQDVSDPAARFGSTDA